MAKPRVFISSTFYDLKYVRSTIEGFVKDIGFDAVLFEKGDIPFHSDKSLEQSCLQEVDICDILVLIIGGRYGSISNENIDLATQSDASSQPTSRSVTRKEYERARDRGVPTFIFIEAGVFSEFKTFKLNKGNPEVKYAHVDSTLIFDLVNDIYNQRRGNFIKSFERVDEIVSWLRDQWAGLFKEALTQKNTADTIKSLDSQLKQLAAVVDSLKTYSEAIVRTVEKKSGETLILEVNDELREELMHQFIRNDLVDHTMKKAQRAAKKNNAVFEDVAAINEIAKDIESTSGVTEFMDRRPELGDDKTWLLELAQVPDDFVAAKRLLKKLGGAKAIGSLAAKGIE